MRYANEQKEVNMEKILRKIHVEDMYVNSYGINRVVFTYKGRMYEGQAVIPGLFRAYNVNLWYNADWQVECQIDELPRQSFFRHLKRFLKAA